MEHYGVGGDDLYTLLGPSPLLLSLQEGEISLRSTLSASD